MKPTHIFIVLILCNIICNLAMSIIAPFFPSFAKTKGIEEDVVGIIFAAHPLGQFIASLILGKLITHDNRSILMNTGIVCQGFGLLIFGLLYYSDSRTFVIVGTLFGRALGGMGASLFMTPFYAFIPQLFPDTIEKKIAISEVSTSLGFLAGPIMGSALYSLGGFVLPFFVFSSFSFLLGVVLYLVSDSLQLPENDLTQKIILHRSIQNESVIDSEFQISYLTLMTNYPVVISFLMSVLTLTIWTFYNATFALYLKDTYDIDEEYSGYYISINAASFGISSMAIAQIKNNKKFWMYFGFVISGFLQFYMGPDYLFTRLHPRKLYTILAWSISGFTAGFPYILTLPQVNSILLKDYRKYPAQCANIASAIFNASLAAGELVGPVAGGYLAQWLGFERAASVLAISVLIVAAMYVPYLFMLDTNPKQKKTKVEVKE